MITKQELKDKLEKYYFHHDITGLPVKETLRKIPTHSINLWFVVLDLLELEALGEKF